MASVSEVRSVVDSIVGSYLGNYNLLMVPLPPPFGFGVHSKFRRTGLSQAQNVS